MKYYFFIDDACVEADELNPLLHVFLDTQEMYMTISGGDGEWRNAPDYVYVGPEDGQTQGSFAE